MSSGIKPPGEAVAAMVEDVLPGVVQVRSRRRRGAGAGFLWSPDGSVVTNHHVVAGSRKIEAVLADDRFFEAEVVGSSRRLDLAMLRLRDAPEDLSPLRLGDSDSLRVGELVFAVGHPWGRRGAVTAGIVSGLGSARRLFGRARYVQTDAHLAPGNSGGPLVNARGEVVGVNAMISGGLSLAVPSNTAGAWASGELGAAPRLGVRVRSVALSASVGRETGLVIFAVRPGGPADRSGLLVGDVLLDVAGEPLKEPASLREALAQTASPSGAVRLRVMRGGETLEIEASFGHPQARGA